MAKHWPDDLAAMRALSPTEYVASALRTELRNNPALAAAQAQMAALRKENKQLQMERDILEKARAWFARRNEPTSPPFTR
jgi:transposase-like protein